MSRVDAHCKKLSALRWRCLNPRSCRYAGPGARATGITLLPSRRARLISVRVTCGETRSPHMSYDGLTSSTFAPRQSRIAVEVEVRSVDSLAPSQSRLVPQTAQSRRTHRWSSTTLRGARWRSVLASARKRPSFERPTCDHVCM